MITLTKNGLSKKVKTGYSWKYLFFGVLYTLSKGDFKGLIIQVVIGSILSSIGGSIALLGLLIGLIYFMLIVPFIYNKKYIKRLIEQGYKPLDADSEMWLQHNINYVGV